MARVTILRPGMMMTVQDAGRSGMLRFGVSGAGAIDAEAMAVANALVGNPQGTAVLEFASFGGALRFEDDRLVAVCGAVVSLAIDGRPVPPWESHRIRAGQELSIGAMRETLWGYVAISGGIATEPVLSARATHLRSAIGGHEGRALLAGDTLPLGEPPAEGRTRRLRSLWRGRVGPVRVVLGPQNDRFAPEVTALFLRAPFTVTQKRDRMAMVLDGPALPARDGHDIVSDGTLPGSIQVPGSGRPMVLLADRQTTGGYPKIATVARVDLARLAQMPAGRAFRFQAVPAEAAEEALIARRAALRAVLTEIAEA